MLDVLRLVCGRVRQAKQLRRLPGWLLFARVRSPGLHGVCCWKIQEHEWCGRVYELSWRECERWDVLGRGRCYELHGVSAQHRERKLEWFFVVRVRQGLWHFVMLAETSWN